MNSELAIFGVLGLKIGFITSFVVWLLISTTSLALTTFLILKVSLIIVLIFLIKNIMIKGVMGSEDFNKKYEKFIK